MNETEITKIRPAARIISTIGQDLVGDSYSAIVELVKNAYDADASFVEITFEYAKDHDKDVLKIDIVDNGHGMSSETVLKKWLVPATKDKLLRSSSPNGRLFQGRKGIGRYAAAILGQELIMKTIDVIGEQTEVLINWDLFEEKEYLDDIDIVVSKTTTSDPPGTALHISANGIKMMQWGRIEIGNLTKELRKLKSPFNNHTPDSFDIRLSFINCPYEELNDQIFDIESFPIIELFDYKISGTVNENGEVDAFYQNNSEPNLPSDKINFKVKFYEGMSSCGPIDFDFRVFDRDNEAIEKLIDKGLIDPVSQIAMGKRDAKRMLDEVYGVNLYREGFRLKPYGNGGIDWLDLDKNRIQNPSYKIGNNQIVGFVNIKPEEISNLQEKSARDGLKETPSYFALVRILKEIIIQLEERRYNYRKKTGKGRQSRGIQNDLVNLFNYEDLTNKIKHKLSFTHIDEKTINEIADIIYREAEIKSKTLENIQNTIAIYQGQATLGKIMTVLLHEVRKPVSYFKQQSPNMIRWLRIYKGKRDWDDDTFEDLIDRLTNFRSQSDYLAHLFKRLDPLAKQHKGEKIDFDLRHAILKAIAIFEGTFEESNITCELECYAGIMINGWEEDLIIALTNLIENSIYWLNNSITDEKKILIEVIEDDEIKIHFKDNGPGIDKSSIETGAIFEPGFSKKLNGTGLGLAIAGEAIDRLKGSIVAHHFDKGAYFTIEFKIK